MSELCLSCEQHPIVSSETDIPFEPAIGSTRPAHAGTGNIALARKPAIARIDKILEM